MNAVAVARKSRRRRHRRANRKNTRRNMARRMRGGMRTSLRFLVQLKNNQGTFSVVDVNANVRQDTKFYTDMFMDIINKLLQDEHIIEIDATDFQVRHIEGNAFEITFEWLYQGRNAQALFDLYKENIKKAFNGLNVFLNDVRYDVVATFT